MRTEIQVICDKANELGFGFNESDAHDMWIAIKAANPEIGERPDLERLLKDAYEFISRGANTFSLAERINLEDRMKETLAKLER